LTGARGVLVNITAGLDMAIGEFEAVGDVVKAFTTDTATVVVGTVIDPDMSDEMRVTVVVTGLGHRQASGHVQSSLAASMKNDGTVDYRQLERPAVLRQPSPNTVGASLDDKDIDYLDIPAFLRRQGEE
jgi:cell division protein FtsZ